MNYSDLCKNYGFNNSIMKEFDKKKIKQDKNTAMYASMQLHVHADPQ